MARGCREGADKGPQNSPLEPTSLLGARLLVPRRLGTGRMSPPEQSLSGDTPCWQEQSPMTAEGRGAAATGAQEHPFSRGLGKDRTGQWQLARSAQHIQWPNKAVGEVAQKMRRSLETIRAWF